MRRERRRTTLRGDDGRSAPQLARIRRQDPILEFVAAVTTPDSDEFVPMAERVAVFDNDGTLSTENPYARLAFAMDRAAKLGKPTTPDELVAGGIGAVLELIKLTHGSITTDEFDAAVRAWVQTARHPRFDRPYPAMVYQPMVELLDLLEAHAFSCWIFSGGGADFMRVWAPATFGIPPHRIIGSSGSVTFQVGDNGPELLKGTDLAVLDDGPQKPISIHQSVGLRPILAAGNTDGTHPTTLQELPRECAPADLSFSAPDPGARTRRAHDVRRQGSRHVVPADHASARARGRAERPARVDRRRRVRRIERVRWPVQHPEHREARSQRPEVQPVPHHRAVLAHPRVAAHRAQPPRGGHGRHHRDRDLRAGPVGWSNDSLPRRPRVPSHWFAAASAARHRLQS
jgi:hypothetical protein